MAEDNDYEETDEETEEEENGAFARVPTKQLRSLEKKARGADAGAAAVRELAFVKAGIDTDSKTGKLVMAAYDGELTTEAIKGFAADIPGALVGQVADSSSAPANPPLAEGEASSTDERNALAEGSADAQATTADPRRVARDDALVAMREGASEADALAGYVNQIAEAGIKGDARAKVAQRR